MINRGRKRMRRTEGRGGWWNKDDWGKIKTRKIRREEWRSRRPLYAAAPSNSDN